MSDELRIGLVGNGAVARLHAAALQGEPGVRIVGVFGPNRDRVSAFAGEFGLELATTDCDALLAQVDAAVITSPSALHPRQASAALRRGCHVLVEMPAAASANEARRLMELAAGEDRVLVAAHTVRWSAANLALRGALHRGAIGKLRSLEIRRCVRTAERRWRDDPLLHHGQHAVDLIRFLAGGFDPTAARHDGAAGTWAVVSGTLPDGARAHIEVRHDCEESSQLIEVAGTEGDIESDGFGRLSADSPVPVEPLDLPAPTAYFDSIRRQDRAFLALVRAGPPAAAMVETLANLSIIDRIRTMAVEVARERTV